MATGFKGEITAWMTSISIVLLFLGSFFIKSSGANTLPARSAEQYFQIHDHVRGAPPAVLAARMGRASVGMGMGAGRSLLDRLPVRNDLPA